MIKHILPTVVIVLIAGCFGANTVIPTPQETKNFTKVAVVSKISNVLNCSFTGLTIFNNTEKTYPIDTNLAQKYQSKLVEFISQKGFKTESFGGNAISYKDTKTGASNWSNIKLGESIRSSTDINTLLILDGGQYYKSTGGYYARNNALVVWSTIYLYDIGSGKLVGNKKIYKSFKRKFDCEMDEIPKNDDILRKAEAAIIESESELVSALLRKY